MTILEFCENRKVQASTVSMYIKRNAEVFEGHVSKSGQHTEIDEEAFKILDAKYPIPPELIPAPDAELQAQLASAKDYIILLQKDAIEHEKLLAKAELDKIMLEEKTVQLLEAKATCDDLQGQNRELYEEIGRLKAQLAQAEQEASRASEEAEKLRNRSFWQRLFNA